MIHAFRNRPSARQLLLLLGGCLVLAAVIAEGLATGYPPTAAATAVSGALCAAALVVPRSRFGLVAAAAVTGSGALSLVSTALAHRPTVTPGMTELCALLLIVTRAVRQSFPPTAIVLGTGAALAAGLVPLRLPHSEYGNVGAIAEPAILLALILACVLGLYLRVLDALRARERQADRAAQRLEYARELHDFVAHYVTAMVAQTKAIRFAAASGHAPGPDELDALLGRVEQAGSQAMDSMRGIVSVLRDPRSPAATRPGTDLARLRELTEAFAGTATAAELTLDPRLTGSGLPPEITTAVHRIVQESLTNTRKHAVDAGRVEVDVRLRSDEPGRLRVTVTDDGRKRAPYAHGRGGFGVLGLTERVEGLGGTLTAGPRPDGAPGWQVHAELPLPDRERRERNRDREPERGGDAEGAGGVEPLAGRRPDDARP